MTNRRQVLLNNRPSCAKSLISLAKNSCHFLRGAIFLYLPPLTNYSFGFLREPRHDRVIYQHVERHKDVCGVGIFIVLATCFHCFIMRREKAEEIPIADRNNRCNVDDDADRVVFLPESQREIQGAARLVFIRYGVQTSTGVNSLRRGSLCPPMRVIAPSGEDTRL